MNLVLVKMALLVPTAVSVLQSRMPPCKCCRHPWHRRATSLKPKYEGTKRRAIEEHRQREEEPHRAQEQARHFWTHNEGG